MKRERLNIVLIICLGVMLFAAHLGVKQFELNQQAWDMWTKFGHDPLKGLLLGHPHGLRYIVYYPSFALADLFGIDPNLVFTYVCLVALCLIAVYAGDVVSDLWGFYGYVLKRDFITISVFAASTLMNGRMILPFLGYLLVAFVGIDYLKHRKWKLGHVIALILGVLLTSLSSGTLVVAMALAAGIVVVTMLRERALFFRTPQLTVSIGLVLLLFAIPTVIGVNKNLAFFGGGSEAIVRMLGHGAGGDIAESLGEDIESAQRPAPVTIAKPQPQPQAQSQPQPRPQAQSRPQPQSQPQTQSTAGAPRYASDLTEYAGKLLQFWWLLVVIAGIIAWSRGWRPIRMIRSASPQKNMLYLAIALAVVGGLFGYSVLTLCIIPVLILVSGRVLPALRIARSRIYLFRA